MNVVLRCPNCGTTRATAGECEACHEAQARYFCTNHRPGLWLDAPVCPRCGARFGGSASVPSAARPAVPASKVPAHSTPAVRAPARVSASSGPPPPSYSRSRPATAAPDGSRASPVRSAPALEEEFAASESGLAPWQRLLGAVLRTRYMTLASGFGRERSLAKPSRGGCLRRLVICIVLLFVGLVIAVVVGGRALLHTFQGY